MLLDDERVVTAMNVDGVQWRPMIDTILAKPFGLIVQTEKPIILTLRNIDSAMEVLQISTMPIF